MLEADAMFDFQVEHIISEKHGGPTTFENLAFACVFCNRYKGSDIASISPTTGELVKLFNPRVDRWSEHFSISGGLLVPRTQIGEVTVRLLQLNSNARVTERIALQAAGRYPLQAEAAG